MSGFIVRYVGVTVDIDDAAVVAEEEEDRCAICLELFKNRFRQTLSCSHQFHTACLVQWLSRKDNCPVCRRPVPQHDKLAKSMWKTRVRAATAALELITAFLPDLCPRKPFYVIVRVDPINMDLLVVDGKGNAMRAIIQRTRIQSQEELTTMKFDGSRSMQEHIIEMTNIAARLKTLGMNVDESFMVQFILNSLPPEYGPFQINYNATNDKWDVNELSSRLAQEESRLKKTGSHSINLMGQGAGKELKSKPKKFKKKRMSDNALQTAQKKELTDRCHFCKREGNYQKDCLKCKALFENKGIIHYVSVCYESNLAEVPSITWWLDTRATSHVSNMMQGFLTIQTTNPNKIGYYGF
ncbi:Zinc finger, RING-type [Corchorus capsularis]|uniref:Zinc finger, RING-type n=1 Tax=Corchorus capsularis TaxID=210143 RepID=A0A1R3K840_COCAP|nr:Zinc finger, RING-type [Corchorus capsularis]